MSSSDNFQQFLDQKQYTKRGVLRYEWIFSSTFLSTGGLRTTEDIIKQLELTTGQQVLDVGCGIGGHSFHMAEKFGANVLGIDLSTNMMSIALEHLSKRPHLTDKVKFVLCDVTETEFEENSFNAIYSRDTLLHIENKDHLFKKFFRWLKPGGRILFTDYTKGDKPMSDEMEKYIKDRGYHLLTTTQYEQVLLKSGFVTVQATDVTEKFLKALREELNRLINGKSDFLKEFSEEDYYDLENGWFSKVQRVNNGDQTWTACFAEKPALY